MALYAAGAMIVTATAGCERNQAAGSPKVEAIATVERAPEHDIALLIKVKNALTEEPELKPFALEVGVQGGIVTLYGEVATPEQRTIAERIAGNVRGVALVKSGIALTAPA